MIFPSRYLHLWLGFSMAMLNMTHRIHVWYIYANIWGILMRSMLPYITYIAAPLGSYGWYIYICDINMMLVIIHNIDRFSIISHYIINQPFLWWICPWKNQVWWLKQITPRWHRKGPNGFLQKLPSRPPARFCSRAFGSIPEETWWINFFAQFSSCH